MASTILFTNIKNNNKPREINMMIIIARYNLRDNLRGNLRDNINYYKFDYEIAKLIVFYNRIDIINTPCFYISPQLLLLSFKHKNFKMLNTLLKHIDTAVVSRFEYIDILYDRIQELNITNILFTYINNDDVFQFFKYVIFNYKDEIFYQKSMIYSALGKDYFWISESQKLHLLYYLIENPMMKEYNNPSNNEKLLFYSATGTIHELKKLLKFKKKV